MSFAGATITPFDKDRFRFIASTMPANYVACSPIVPLRRFCTHYDVPTLAHYSQIVSLAEIVLRTVVTARPMHEPPFAALWKRIRAFTGLEAGWKGPGSIPVPQAAIDDAERFSLAVMTSDTIEPDFVGAAADGELMITWRAPNIFVDVGFHGTGTYSVYADIAGNEHLEDDRSANQPLPEHVLKALIRTSGQQHR